MNEKKIIELWNQGYTVEQIVDKYEFMKIAKKRKLQTVDKLQEMFQNKVESTILQYLKDEER